MADEIFVGSVAVGVVPDARGWNRKLAADLIPSSDVIGKEYGQRLSKGIVNEMGRTRPDMAREGERSGGAFADTFRKRIDAAIKTLPKVKLDGDSTQVDRKVDALRAKLVALSQKKIGIDIKSDDALKEIAVIETELDAVGRKAGNIDVRFNTVEARAQLALLKHEANKTGDQAGAGLAQRILMGIATVGSGAGSSAGSGASAGGGIVSSLGPFGLAIAGALGLFALPFIAQVAAGGIVAAFGGAIAGMAIIGAAKDPAVVQTFKDMKDRIVEDLQIIGQSWVPVLESILNTAKQTMDHLTPVFTNAAKIIAGPFRLFADTLIRSFTQPEVSTSIMAVARAFSDILKAMAPQLPGMVATLAGAVERIAKAISANPKAFANFINFLVQIAAFALNAIAILTRLATFMEGRFKRNINDMVATWKAASSGVHRAWSDFINFFVLTGHQLEAAWNRTCGAIHGAWSVTVNFLHRAWSAFINFWVLAGHQIEAAWNRTCGAIHNAWANTVNFIHRAWSAFINFWVAAGHQIESIWNSVCGSIHKAWSNTVNFITGLWHSGMTFIQNAVNAMWGVVHTVFGKILSAASWAFGWIPGIGPKLREASARFNNFRDNANNSLAGIKDRTVNVGVKMGPAQQSIASPAFRAQYGKASGGMITYGSGPRADDVPILASRGEFMQPADSVAYYGVDFMEAIRAKRFAAGGLIPGIHLPSGASIQKSLWGQLTSFVSSAWHSIGGFFSRLVGGGSGGGVSQWAGTASQALSLLGLSQGLLGRVLYQMGTESGGNPNAINNWDINAQRGDPSRGLMQVIGSTFAAYHVPGTSWNIYDPLANIAAAINYARHVYGPTLGALGSGHGYADGGPITEPIVGFGLGTGLMYKFGERGPEWVSPGGRPRGGDGSAVAYHAHFDGLTGAVIESHVRSAFTAMAITDGSLQRQGRRS